MTSKAQNVINTLQKVFENLNRPLVIVETGTIRNLDESFIEGDGYSTQFIAEWVRDNNEATDFYSIDLFTETARKYLMSNFGTQIYVQFIANESLKVLPEFPSIDFCYLDSSYDPDNFLSEFLIAWPKITKGGALMADDCSLEVAECTKGDKLIPYLIENNIPFKYRENKIFGKTQIVLWK